jgi:hypothetical protein
MVSSSVRSPQVSIEVATEPSSLQVFLNDGLFVCFESQKNLDKIFSQKWRIVRQGMALVVNQRTHPWTMC